MHAPPSLAVEPELELLDVLPELVDVPELPDEVELVVELVDVPELSALELLDVVASEKLELADAPELPNEAEDTEVPGDAEHAAAAAMAHVGTRNERALMSHTSFPRELWRVQD